MSQLKIANKSTPDQEGTSSPPPIPGAPGIASQAKSNSETTGSFLPPQNGEVGAKASSASTTPPGPPPPPPPQLSSSPAAARHTALMGKKGNGRGSKRMILALVCLLFLGGIGSGIFFFLRNPDFFSGWNSPAAPAHWPAIDLSGMAGGAAKNETGSAILNGSLIAVNQRIDGATLIAIEDNGVVLEYRHEKKFIRIGESTR